tara:strand:- start:529 stop:846 length:318 start_codon:yes stop_codon:yes gene_type:complete
MKSINIQYEKLVQDYLESLNTQLRGFSPSKELDFLATWTPDDNITYSILSIIECAYESELKELSIILNSKSKAEFNFKDLEQLTNKIAKINCNIVKENLKLNVYL